MKYLCLIYSEEKKLETMSESECLAYDEALPKSGNRLNSKRDGFVESIRNPAPNPNP